jgi:sirohydrochlorin ferrochelatase
MTDQIKYGVMICGHGSRSQSAVDEFAAMAVKMKSYFPDWPVEYGYLEFANPVIRVGLDKLRERASHMFWQSLVCYLRQGTQKMIFRLF